MTRTWNDEIIYHILIDRFVGHRPVRLGQPDWAGGTIRDVISKLDHVQSLGATCLLLSPFFQTSQYHGYHVTDFYRVDERFGALQDVQYLVAELHRRDMRLLIDYVPNHCSNQHPFFVDAVRNRDSQYREWFLFDHWPNDYKMFLDVPELPKFNLAHPPTKQYLIDNALWWLERVPFDGMRVDHAIGPVLSFWQEFIPALKAKKPELIFIGEATFDRMPFKFRDRVSVPLYELVLLRLAPNYMRDVIFKRYLRYFDGLLDFGFVHFIDQYAAGKISYATLERKLRRHYQRFAGTQLLPTFLDNHDMDRIMFVAGNDIAKVEQLIRLQFSLPHSKVIYTGTEFGLTQTQPVTALPDNGDTAARECIDWPATQKGVYPLQTLYRSLATKRHKP